MPDAAALERARTWFASKGWHPFPWQEEAWRAFLSGESGLVHAPTGTGKTLAVWIGPLLDALAAPATGNGLRVLWLTPLRALAADTVESLRDAAAGLGVDWRIEARTGDTSQSLRAKQRRQLPQALVTTPESLSLLLSYDDARDRLRGLSCVVVDEWHELLGTKRGVQVELALARLREWNPGMRTWGLSATLGNVQQAAEVLLGAGRHDARLVSGDDHKAVVVETVLPASVQRFPWAGHLGLASLPRVVEAIEQRRTTLLFTNTRSQAEQWFQALTLMRPDWEAELALHHGSLDRALRNEVEEGLRAGRWRCVVCTSSLDLGVDFAPVEQVVQVGSPKGVARLLQRAGRSGHQPGGESRVLCAPTHALELVEYAAARRAIARRALEGRRPVERPLDVLVQHLLTIAAGGGFEEEALRREVRSTYAFHRLSDAEWQWALAFAAHGGPALGAYEQYARLVRGDDDRWVVASSRTARLHRLQIGTITSDGMLQVRFLRGGPLGQVEEGFLARLRPGDVFVFGGRRLMLSRIQDMTAWVRLATRGTAQVPRWMGGRLPLSTHLAAAVREELDRGRAPRDDEPPEVTALRPLMALQDRWSCIPAPDQLLVEVVKTRDGWHHFLFPFEGRAVHEGLGALVAFRLTRLAPRSITTTATDYGLELLSRELLTDDAEQWRAALSPANLLDDLEAAIDAGELSRRRFREIARVAGLVFTGYPGAMKNARQLQVSSGLLFDVFRRYDPENRLLEQAHREVLESQLEVGRLHEALARIAASRVVVVKPPRITPLAFPLWAERVSAQYSSESWRDRVQKMALQLEAAAEPRSRARRAG
jgi:ATP-dependent Lhr-like helicase